MHDAYSFASALIGGIISGGFLLRINYQNRKAREREEQAKVRIQYLNPLQVAAGDLKERFAQLFNGWIDLAPPLQNTGNYNLLHDTLVEFKNGKCPDWKEGDHANYVKWANEMGHLALSTLYLTVVYFARATKLRSEFSSAKLTPQQDRELLEHLNGARIALGGEFNIWEDLQDSLGFYIRKQNGNLMTYREFCEEVFDTEKRQWYGRLIAFFHDLHMKPPQERKAIIESLSRLIDFLEKAR